MFRVAATVCFYALLLTAFGGLTFALIPARIDGIASREPNNFLAELPPSKRAQRALLWGRPDLAVEAYTEMMHTGAITALKVSFLLEKRSLAYEQAGRFDEALEDLNKMVRFQACDYDALKHRARISIRRGEYRKAMEDYEECSRTSESDVEILHGSALAAVLAGEPEKAIGDCTTLVARSASDVYPARRCAAYRDRAAIYRVAGNLKGALADATEAVRLGVYEGRNYTERAKAYLRSGLFANAVADIDAAMRLPGFTDAAYDLRGRALLAAGRYKDALESFNQAIEASPRANYYAHRSQAYQALGMIERAAKDAERAERIRQNAPAAARPAFRGTDVGDWLDDTLCALDE